MKAGHKLSLVMWWPHADERFERWLKNRQDTSSWCPHCVGHERDIPKLEDMPRVSMEELWKEHKRLKENEKTRREIEMDKRLLRAGGLSSLRAIL